MTETSSAMRRGALVLTAGAMVAGCATRPGARPTAMGGALASLVLVAALSGAPSSAEAQGPCAGAKTACVVSASPSSGSLVPPGPTILRVEFDRPMRQDSYSITNAPGGAPPPVAGPPRFSADGRTFELPLSLQPDLTYALSVNSETHRNFRGLDGTTAAPHGIVFRTDRSKAVQLSEDRRGAAGTAIRTLSDGAVQPVPEAGLRAGP
jgi:hypothetical protein